MRRVHRLLFVVVVTLCSAMARPARGQAVVTVNDDVNLRFGVLGQVWADTIDDPASDAQTKNLFVRRIRLILGGQVARNVTFFVETDAPNLGRSAPGTKNAQPSVIVQDAFASVAASAAFTVDAGLMFVPFSHNSIQSAATLLPIDYGPYTFTQTTVTQSSTGRDAGFQARGNVLDKRLEYRLGVFQGARDTASHNDFRYAGRVQYDFLDPEVGFFYAGTYLGKKRIVSVGAAFDRQMDYSAYDVDAFVDHPLSATGAITAQLDYQHFDGDVTFPTLRPQRALLAEAGYLVVPIRLTPFVQYSSRNLEEISAGDENRTSAGVAYWWAAHNASVKGAYTRLAPTGLPKQNEFTLQLQIFFY